MHRSGTHRHTAPRACPSLSLPAPDASQDSENNQIRKIIIASGLTTRFAGDALGSGDDDLRGPVGVAIAPDGTFALVAVRAWPASPRRALLQTAHPHLLHTPQLYPFL